ncbi:MAG: amidohydrolase family protein, partial [Actinomycetota bacterium]
VASIGHSAASYDLARAAADAGARSVTHLFNAMKPLHHRDPGLVGAALDDDRLTPGVIADLIHVHPAALRVVFARKPNVALVSDSVGIKAPELAEMKIAYVDGAPRLADGTLAGSTLTLDVAVRNVVSLGVPLERAVDMATRVPADLIGAHDRGRLDPGARADLVLLDSRELTVRAVWLGGHLVFGSPHS